MNEYNTMQGDQVHAYCLLRASSITANIEGGSRWAFLWRAGRPSFTYPYSNVDIPLSSYHLNFGGMCPSSTLEPPRDNEKNQLECWMVITLVLF